MKTHFLLIILALAASNAAVAQPVSAACQTGVYLKDQTHFVALTKADKGYGYTFSDGITGYTEQPDPAVVCRPGAVAVGADTWPKLATLDTDTRFASHGVQLAGRLMLPPGAGKDTPLVVIAHGSEATGWIDRARDPYQMVGRGVAVFVYDKRGTGMSGGEYTQNLPLLADDLVAASSEAKRLAAGHFGRFGLMGLSQGGWVAPLAATRAQAQFLGIGYGLAVDIAEQDAAQVALEMQARGYGSDVVAKARTLTDITARIARSGAKDGLDDLAAAQARYGKEPWFAQIKGGFTGILLGMPADTLRQQGIPALDKLNVDWSVDPVQVLRGVDVPQLWAFADDDRQAPFALTVERLTTLRNQGKSSVFYFFPDAEHGMFNYRQAPDGTRKHTRMAPGFYDLMADWAKGKLAGPYGAATRQ